MGRTLWIGSLCTKENGFAVNHAEANRFLKRTGVGEADKIEIDEFSIRKHDDHSYSLVIIFFILQRLYFSYQ